MKKIIFAQFLMLLFVLAEAQEKAPHEVHASFINNFMKYVQWPNDGEGGEFIIGVLGDDDLFNTLKSWHEGKMKGSKKLVVKKLTGISEASSCSLVYLAKSKSKEFEAMKGLIAGKPVLTITDGNNLGQKGSCFNFKEVDGKLKFELNQGAINAASLKVSSSLASIAILI